LLGRIFRSKQRDVRKTDDDHTFIIFVTWFVTNMTEIIKIKIKWAGNGALMGEMKTFHRILIGKLKRRGNV